jgi:hypothetical protein
MLKCDAMYENLVTEDQNFSEVFWEHCTLKVEAGFFPRNVGYFYIIGGVKLHSRNLEPVRNYEFEEIDLHKTVLEILNFKILCLLYLRKTVLILNSSTFCLHIIFIYVCKCECFFRQY